MLHVGWIRVDVGSTFACSTGTVSWSRRPRRPRTPMACAAWRSAWPGHLVRAVIESMNGARFVHDTLEEHGWEVLIADA